MSEISEIGVVGVSGPSHWGVSRSYSPFRVVDSSKTSDSGSENESVLAGVEALDESEHIVRDRGEGGRWLARIMFGEVAPINDKGSCVMKGVRSSTSSKNGMDASS